METVAELDMKVTQAKKAVRKLTQDHDDVSKAWGAHRATVAQLREQEEAELAGLDLDDLAGATERAASLRTKVMTAEKIMGAVTKRRDQLAGELKRATDELAQAERRRLLLEYLQREQTWILTHIAPMVEELMELNAVWREVFGVAPSTHQPALTGNTLSDLIASVNNASKRAELIEALTDGAVVAADLPSFEHQPARDIA